MFDDRLLIFDMFMQEGCHYHLFLLELHSQFLRNLCPSDGVVNILIEVRRRVIEIHSLSSIFGSDFGEFVWSPGSQESHSAGLGGHFGGLGGHFGDLWGHF